MTDQTTKTVNNLICDHLGICGEELDPSLSFSGDYNIGPRELLPLILNIEEQYDIEIDREEIKKVSKIQDLIDLTKDLIDEI